MKVLVCGGRTFGDWRFVDAVLDEIHLRKPITLIIHGAAYGADTLAGSWAVDRGVPVNAYPAEWAKYGKRAGHLRNAQMLEQGKPDLVVAFPGGPGTANMVAQATKAGVEVYQALKGKPL